MADNKNPNHKMLHQLYVEQKTGFNRHFDARMRRALSWLERAEKENGEPHTGFILYWISFNACYLPKLGNIRDADRANRRKYFSMITECDTQGLIHDLVWQKRNAEIKRLLKNQFIYGPFWNTPDPTSDLSWKVGFNSQKRQLDNAFEAKNTVRVLSILFGRLYVLRNQLMHGSATWNGERNRPQVDDGYKIISKLQGLFLLTMLNHPSMDWGKVPHDLYAEGFDDY